MSELSVNGIRLYYEEHGEGAPILCIHGTSSSALMWAEAVGTLARLGRVIVYDRRGCTRSERPQPYERTSVSEHAEDAAALLDALRAAPAIVIGRSYGGAVAIELARLYADLVRALVLLEPAPLTALSPAMAALERHVGERIRDVAAADGVDAVGRAFIGEVLGPEAWDSFPLPIRRMLADNSAAILAEHNGDPSGLDRAALAGIDRPTLAVTAADSHDAFREVTDALAAAMPDARVARIEGGHLITPAHPAVLAYLEAQLSRELPLPAPPAATSH